MTDFPPHHVNTGALLLAEIEAFLKHTGMAPTRFSMSATRDRHFVRTLRNGRKVSTDTADQVRLFMRNYEKPAAMPKDEGAPAASRSGPTLAAIPTAADKMAGDFAQITRFWAQMREAADEIAATRRALFEAYVAKGFTPAEALALVSGSLML